MKMEFIFDEEKLNNSGYTEEFCLRELKEHFDKFRSKTLKEISKGVYEGTEDDFNAFLGAGHFPYTKWFLEVIKEWYLYADEEDGKGIQKEDCLEAYYKVIRNRRRGVNV